MLLNREVIVISLWQIASNRVQNTLARAMVMEDEMSFKARLTCNPVRLDFISLFEHHRHRSCNEVEGLAIYRNFVIYRMIT
jgi:hypothetical protein